MSRSSHLDQDKHQHLPQNARANLRDLMARYALPTVDPVTVGSGPISSQEATLVALSVLENFNAALKASDVEKLESCFLAKQAFWKDQLSLTWHLRTFISPAEIATGLLETRNLRDMTGNFELKGEAEFVRAGPNLRYIACQISFKTAKPAATCNGMLWLLPVNIQDLRDKSKVLTWKIWILSTKLENLESHPEDETLLRSGRKLSSCFETIETDVFIVGAGNAAMALAARLKALGVHSVMVERNASVGDNWALRYDCMKFHIPTSFCDLPYLEYPPEVRNRLLTRSDLSTQIERYAQTFELDVINSVEITRTTLGENGRWHVEFATPSGTFTAFAKHLVQATGIGSQKPHLPSIKEPQIYKGISIHSSQFENAKKLGERGVKTVCVVGSGNTAFDVLEDCHSAGLRTTMIVRSPTYIIPIEYIRDERSLGAYDHGVEEADGLFMMLPTIVDSQLGRELFSQMAAKESDRYSALHELGFPVFDSHHPDAALMHHLIERGGGHYVDTGATALLMEQKVDFVADVEPREYTATGLKLSNEKTLDMDAVIWCTGFADKDVRDTVSETLKISLPLDATWGIDDRGDIRGMWKRHSHVHNYWVMGGYTQQHRWFSRLLAQQIKAELEGILPPAYRAL